MDPRKQRKTNVKKKKDKKIPGRMYLGDDELSESLKVGRELADERKEQSRNILVLVTLTVGLADDIMAMVARASGDPTELGISELTFLRVTSVRRTIPLTDGLRERVGEMLLQLADIPDDVLMKAEEGRFWVTAKEVSRENIVVTVNSGCRMIPNYELYLMRMAQAMSEELKRSIKLPHVEHSLFGKIIRRGETRRQMEREAESLHRGGGVFGFENQGGSNVPQNVR